MPRSRLAIWMGLIALAISSSSCATTLPPQPVRACYTGLLTAEAIPHLDVKYRETAKPGDLILSPRCDQENIARLANEIRAMNKGTVK